MDQSIRAAMAEARDIVGSIPQSARDKLLAELLWELFGEIDEDEEPYFTANRTVRDYETKAAINKLREFFEPAL